VADDNIIKRLAFRLVKKHIAGFTTESALKAVRTLNAKGLHATVTFLNEHVHDQVKARYNTNTYMQLVRQLSRLHLNASISLRLSQLGYTISESYGERNLSDLLDVAEESRKFIWLEEEHNSISMQRIYRKLKPRHQYMGMEAQPGYGGAKPDYSIKVRYYLKKNMPLKNSNGSKSMLRDYMNSIAKLAEKVESVTVFEKDPQIIAKMANSHIGKRNLIFELPLGYEQKADIGGKLVQRMSVYVPYGKDWVPYIMSSIAEGKVKRVATALLDGEHEKEGHKYAD